MMICSWWFKWETEDLEFLEDTTAKRPWWWLWGSTGHWSFSHCRFRSWTWGTGKQGVTEKGRITRRPSERPEWAIVSVQWVNWRAELRQMLQVTVSWWVSGVQVSWLKEQKRSTTPRQKNTHNKDWHKVHQQQETPGKTGKTSISFS